MFAVSRRMWLPVVFLAALVAGCGGGESRKARHLEKGQTFMAAGNFEKARVEFRNALQIAPNDSEVRFENGVIDEKLGNQREAAQFYQGAIEVGADNVRARVALARLYLLGGAPNQALETINPALLKHPDDAGLLTMRVSSSKILLPRLQTRSERFSWPRRTRTQNRYLPTFIRPPDISTKPRRCSRARSSRFPKRRTCGSSSRGCTPATSRNRRRKLCWSI
jgi:tetratricopeptide (TPR) repeat protein